jgi:hypothetical protein
VWASPALPGARHDMGAAREHGLIEGLNTAGIRAVADTAYQGGGPAIRVPQRRRRLDRDSGRSPAAVAPAGADQYGSRRPARSGTVLRRIRSCPSRATALVQAVMVLIQIGWNQDGKAVAGPRSKRGSSSSGPQSVFEKIVLRV